MNQSPNSPRSANIRNMFTRFRIDANCTLDSCHRSFRYKSVEDSLCKICNVVQSVDHVLLYCKGKDLTTNRIIFEDKLDLCKYVPKYCSLSDEHKLQMVLNFRPLWKKANENEAVLNRLVQFNVIRHYVETNLFPYYS